MRAFAGGDDAVKSIRWLEYEDTGKFKGCGFVQFYTVVGRQDLVFGGEWGLAWCDIIEYGTSFIAIYE